MSDALRSSGAIEEGLHFLVIDMICHVDDAFFMGTNHKGRDTCIVVTMDLRSDRSLPPGLEADLTGHLISSNRSHMAQTANELDAALPSLLPHVLWGLVVGYIINESWIDFGLFQRSH